MCLINKNDRIFVAGHNGMVGSSILKELKKNDYKNILTSSKKDLNLLRSDEVENWFKKYKPNIVILAAAKVGGIEANSNYPADFILENLKIQTNVIESSFKNNVKRFLFLGSSCIYPKLCNQPIQEEYLLTGALESTNEPYAIAKIAGIKLCSSLKVQHGFDALSLMPTNLYGPGDNYHSTNSHVMPSLIKKFYHAKKDNLSEVICWGTGKPKREFLFVEDLAEASLYFLENISSNNELLYTKDSKYFGIVNVGTGKDISIKELSILIASEFDYQGDIVWDPSKPDGTPRKLLNVNKANKMGWSANTKLKDGIRKTIRSFQEQLTQKTIRV